ncbi:T9SS type A sorting domain-containing protein [Kaistella sp.]|uniref:T9SS type A sorting domain-containing protein n=1 Tax=Kaistella sp. TaxID=2782235 RepID=UPI003C462E94
MKKLLLFSAFLAAGIMTTSNAQTDPYGYTQVNATTGPGYQNQVFFDLSENKLTAQSAAIWDVAFYRNGTAAFGTRVNDAQAIDTYQASTDPTQWDNIDIAHLSTWGEPLYNPDLTESLEEGAFEQADLSCSILSTGWGCYNIGSHHIDGKTIYVLKYPNNTYFKFMITDYFGGYTFKYSKWNGTTWDTTISKTIANGTADSYFNYYSLLNNQEVTHVEPPKDKWDFMMTRYWTFYNGIMMYQLSGVIQSPRITVAKASETQATSAINLPDVNTFKKVITTIGHSWKPTSGLIPDVVYYIKEDQKYYRMYFTENGGGTTGNMYFKYKDISDLLASNEVNTKVTFGLYPNPAPNKQVTLLYDVKNDNDKSGSVSIMDMTGKVVYTTEISKQQGFFKKELHLGHLPSGSYIVSLKSGTQVTSKKLILQ